MIVLKEFSLQIGTKKLFEHCDFDFQNKMIYSIFGDNGSGKSTLFYLLSGENPPYSGHCIINGFERNELSSTDISRLVSLCASTQHIQNITVRELLEFSDIDLNKNKEIDNYFELKPFLERNINSLSDGEKQWLFIVRAFMADKPIVLLDEPTSFLDRTKRQKLLTFLSDYIQNNDKTILINSHDTEFMDFADSENVQLENLKFSFYK